MYGAWGRTQSFPPSYHPRMIEVIARASGFAKDLNVTEATLIREMRNGKLAFVKLDLHRIAT